MINRYIFCLEKLWHNFFFALSSLSPSLNLTIYRVCVLFRYMSLSLTLYISLFLSPTIDTMVYLLLKQNPYTCAQGCISMGYIEGEQL